MHTTTARIQRLQITLDQAKGKQYQQRLCHAHRWAMQHTLRRLRAEKHQPPAQEDEADEEE